MEHSRIFWLNELNASLRRGNTGSKITDLFDLRVCSRTCDFPNFANCHRSHFSREEIGLALLVINSILRAVIYQQLHECQG